MINSSLFGLFFFLMAKTTFSATFHTTTGVKCRFIHVTVPQLQSHETTQRFLLEEISSKKKKILPSAWEERSLRIRWKKWRKARVAAGAVCSFLQLELEGLCAPLGDITVQHGALGEADVILVVDQDNGVRPESECEKDMSSEQTCSLLRKYSFLQLQLGIIWSWS